MGNIHRSVVVGRIEEFTEKDQEVRRRLLTAILSQVRAIFNTGIVEFSVVHNLEEDCQKALDANEEEKEYDLFAFLDNRQRSATAYGHLYNMFVRVLEGDRLRGEMVITTVFIISSIMGEILKEEMLHESPLVQYQACLLYTSPSPRDQRGSRMPSSA